ncbi:hypothetical protein L1987_19570 [Smallanthus sonchifolius]|uniref:Uncharacterized protein n=1 Tax=Smallanthus sonchifolius TaxID=185202 RepID=A0ACB9IR54_9ASTR|nr:hypothetical protein L1987_19570 [Smallanthus sonchifolius]
MGLFEPLKKPGTLILCFVLYSIVTEMGVKGFVYDGEKTSFTVGLLPGTKHEFPVLLENLSSNRTVCCGSSNTEETKRSRRPPQSKSYTVKISCATKIPIRAIFNALQGEYSEHLHEAIRVLGVLLRQHAVKQLDLVDGGSSVTAKEMWGFDYGNFNSSPTIPSTAGDAIVLQCVLQHGLNQMGSALWHLLLYGHLQKSNL